jgi:hypothetical protein
VQLVSLVIQDQGLPSLDPCHFWEP